MSRKKKVVKAADTDGTLPAFGTHTTVEDDGGLDLTLKVPVPAAKPGMTLYQAVEASQYLHLAAHLYAYGTLVVSNGMRLWTANARTFEPGLIDGTNLDDQTERTRTDWLPVFGDCSGWHI